MATTKQILVAGVWFLVCAGFFVESRSASLPAPLPSLPVAGATCGGKQGRIPRAASVYRAELVRSARAVWGLDAPIAVFAAQVHTESWWRNDTVSQAGAQGLAQFLPATANWLPQVAPALTRVAGRPAPFNPGWSLRALVTYDLWLHERVQGVNPCERMAFALSAYNGGLGWVKRDKRLAVQEGLCADRWFGHTATVNAGRKASNFRENRNYVRLILQERQTWYCLAGWGQGVHCDE
ncbi:MAG: transglycosylase SLT domain-containing protein [Bilophila sp.]